jgi:hypothetical protein
VFVLVVGVMTGLGQAVARAFVRFQPLNAYRLDILGSIAGIAAFSVLSFLDQPPATWGAVAGVGLVVLLLPRARDRRPVRAGLRHRPEQQASIPARTCMTRKLALRKRLPGHLGAVRRVWGPG